MKELIESLNLPKLLLDKTDKFMTTLFGPSAREIGELFADKIRYKRLKNQIDIFKKTIEILDSNNLNARQLNLKTLVPLIENSSLEEDGLLQEKWANLIANISSSPETGLEPKLVKTLSNMSSLEAQVLDFCYEQYNSERLRIFEKSKSSKWLNYKSVNDIKIDRVLIKFDLIQKRFNLTDEFTKICVDNLEALGLIRYEEPEIEIDNGDPTGALEENEDTGESSVKLNIEISANYNQSDDFNLTTYGNYFIQQCKIKNENAL
jgi:hypothetical protein